MSKTIVRIVLLSLLTVTLIYPPHSTHSQGDPQIISKANVDTLQRQAILGCDGNGANLCDERGLYAETLSFSPDSSIVGALFPDYTIRFWNTRDYTPLPTLNSSAYDFGFSPDGKWLAVVNNAEIVLLDSSTFSQVHSLSQDNLRFSCMAFDPTSQLLVGAGADAVLWNLSTGEMLNHFDVLERWWPVSAIAYSPNSQLIAIGRLGPGDINIWSTEQLKTPIFTLREHSGPISSLTFSPDSALLASGSEDNTIRLWDMSTGEQVSGFSFRREVFDVAFSPDGTLLAVASGLTVSIFDVASMDKLVVLIYPPGRVYSVAFSPDGKLLAVGVYNQGVQLWGTVDES